MSCTTSDIWWKGPWPTIRLPAAVSSSTSPSAMPTAWSRRWDPTRDRPAWCPVIRSRRWPSASSISSRATRSISTRRSSSSTTAARRPSRTNTHRATSRSSSRMRLWVMPSVPPICMRAWPTWPRLRATQRTSMPSTASGTTSSPRNSISRAASVPQATARRSARTMSCPT